MVQTKTTDGERSLVEGIIEALSDKHSQVDISLQGMSVKFPNIGIGVELNGLVTVSAHVRDITEDERKASASKNIALMAKA
jgi:hypothetical protein